MTERSFFDYGSQPGDFDRLDPRPWERRFQGLDSILSTKTGRRIDQRPRGRSNFRCRLAAHSWRDHRVDRDAACERIQSLCSNPRRRIDSVVRSILPEHYEPGYAYPLVLWFHGDGSSEAEISSVMPNISDRNYHRARNVRGNRLLRVGFWLVEFGRSTRSTRFLATWNPSSDRAAVSTTFIVSESIWPVSAAERPPPWN